MKRLLLLICLFAFGATPLFARSHHSSDGSDHVQFGNTITIGDGAGSGDIVCVFCKIHVQGNVSGDMVSLFSDVDVAPEKTIAGDVVVIGGHLTLAGGSELDRDLVLFGGYLSQDPTAITHGDRVLFQGGGWLVLALTPLLIPIGFLWLIIHFIRRSRYRFPAYPGGRRF